MIEHPKRERGGGDHDEPYRFGKHPLTYLHAREYARLLIKFPRRDADTASDIAEAAA